MPGTLFKINVHAVGEYSLVLFSHICLDVGKGILFQQRVFSLNIVQKTDNRLNFFFIYLYNNIVMKIIFIAILNINAVLYFKLCLYHIVLIYNVL